VIEAIIEKIEAKQALYEKLEAVRRPGSAVSSNTSTMPLAMLTQGRSEAFQRDFLITHFFNPPRYMRLLEVVAGPQSDPALVAGISAFADRALGKSVVTARDTPGFIANRVGTFWLQSAINAAFDLGVSVEDADAIAGKPMGVPKTGIFGLVDLVGIDLMPYLKTSLTRSLPQDDPYQAIAKDHPLILKMIGDGYTGRKGKGGFYRINREAGKVKEAIDLATGEYRKAAKPVSIPGAAQKDLRALVSLPGKLGAYAWAVLGPTLAYSASLVGEAADDVLAIDTAMKLGYNWSYGPFELIDRLGSDASPSVWKPRASRCPRSCALRRGVRSTAWTMASASSLGWMASITPSPARKACCCWRTSRLVPSLCSRMARRRCGTWATALSRWSSPAR
jgi:3-hydroxyacyl-CoA dehydrogenase